MSEDFITVKQRKLERIRAFIKSDLDFTESKLNFNFLNNDLKKKYGLSESDNISSHGYDEYAQEIINENERGMILDCGCGLRNDYLGNIVNFEIVPYESTDVVGLGESLPFIDNCFDAVLSLNVLEHVKNPFQCAAEISRVLKPGGKLYCVAAFLQPVHAFPDHYFNMTKGGMKLLFEKHLQIDEQKIIQSGLPIFSLTWILQRWYHTLPHSLKEQFLQKRVMDLIGSPTDYLTAEFVTNLPEEVNEELASTTALFATKK
jgi:SAM-dependent methyltransferase